MVSLPTGFSGVQAALGDATAADAERLVARLKEKARTTRSRELEALAWFAKGIHEAAQQRLDAAEQSLLVAVNIGRDLFREENDALGHIARFLGFVHAKRHRADAASEMFLLARNVFLKTEPSRAAEVIRCAASCNIALELPAHALAIIHQEIGAPEERSAPKSADALELHLVRARAFEAQQKPLQALKALARTTQLWSPDPQVRLTVIRAWIEIAHIWKARCDPIAAFHALGCASACDGGRLGAHAGLIVQAAIGLELHSHEFSPALAWQVQRAVGSVVAFASPLRGLFFQGGGPFDQGSVVAAEHLPDGRWAVRRDQKLAVGSRRNVFRGMRRGAELTVGEHVHVDDGMSEPVVRTVIRADARKIVLHETGPHTPAIVAGRRLHGVDRFTASVWVPGEAGRLPRDGDDVIHELLKETA